MANIAYIAKHQSTFIQINTKHMKQRNAKSFFKASLFVSATIVALTLGSGIATAAPADNTTQTQGVKATGIVRDANGEPVIGANVLEKGTSNGTITDFEGKFELLTAKGATLVVSYVGYETKEAKAGTNVVIVLSEDSEVLEDVVITALGIKKDRKALG